MQLTTLWLERGVPLREAPEKFATARLSTPVLPKPPDDSQELRGGLKMLADGGEWSDDQRQSLKSGVNAIQQVLASVSAIRIMNHERQQHVANLVLRGKVLAVGFPEQASKPQVIPAYLFETDTFIKWNKSQIDGNGHHFISVRIIKLRPSETLALTSPKEIEFPKLKIGRPSAAKLVEIINTLNANPAFGTLSRKEQRERVIDYANINMREHFPNGKNLSPSTVSRYLVKTLTTKMQNP